MRLPRMNKAWMGLLVLLVWLVTVGCLWNLLPVQSRATLVGARFVCFSPDSSLVAALERDGTIALWDVTTGSKRVRFQGLTGRVSSTAFSPDGQTVATGSSDKTVKLWDTVTGQERATLAGHTEPIHWVGFSPDGTTLATVDQGKALKLWETTTKRERATFATELPVQWERRDIGTAQVFAPDGRTVVTVSRRGRNSTVTLWDVATGQPRAILKDTSSPWVFSPDSKTLATRFLGSSNLGESVKLWDVTTGQERATLQVEKRMVSRCLAFAPDGKTLAISYSEYELNKDQSHGEPRVALWDVATCQQQAVLEGARAPLEVFFAHQGEVLLTTGDRSSQSSRVVIWDVRTGQKRVGLPFGGRGDLLGTLSPDDRTFAVRIISNPRIPFLLSEDDYRCGVQLVDVSSGQELSFIPTGKLHLRGWDSFIEDMVFSPDGKIFASCIGTEECDSGTSLVSHHINTKLWDIPPRKPLGLVLGGAALVTVLIVLAVWGGSTWVRKKAANGTAGRRCHL